MTNSWTILLKSYEDFLLLEEGASSHTRKAYLSDVDKLFLYAEQEVSAKNPSDLSSGDLENFLVWLGENGIGASSQARILSGIKSFFKYLTIERLIDIDPTTLLEGPRSAHKLPEVLTLQEIEAMIGQIDHSKNNGLRNRAIIETLYSCGLRVSELISLKVSAIHRDIGFVQVTGKKNKERIVPIGAVALEHIDYYLQHVRSRINKIDPSDRDILFLNNRGRSLSRIMIFKIVKDLASRAEIKKNVSPHTFRHSFATHMVKAGADLRAVQEMLGHESITTTEIYTHMDRQYLRDILYQYHPLLKATSS